MIDKSLTPLLALAALACGGSPPRSQQSMHQDGVPANSLSERRVVGDDKKPEISTAKKEEPAKASDSTQPLLTPVSPSGGDDAHAPGNTKKTGKVTKAECQQLFDRYIELAVGSDARLEGLPPELIAQAKAQARQQKGDPCETQVVARAKYNCAMAATSTGQWQKCMK